ncbi:MAG: hypothetical protein K2Q09_02950, partial [Phycisphaerales bacterium]|nr:hypothetical protein [Phycisphaerales bacterium]
MLALLLTAAIVAPDYAVLVSRRTDADPSWHKVVQKLTEKHHGASVIIYDGDISTARDALAAQMPLYTAVVAKPDELGRGVVASVHRMMR